MASRTRIREGMSLEEFLELPEDKPYLEYIDGRIEAKVSPQKKHSLLTVRFVERLNRWAEPARAVGCVLLVLRASLSQAGGSSPTSFSCARSTAILKRPASR